MIARYFHASFKLILTKNGVQRKSYSDWYRKRPAISQFSADIEGEPYKTTVTIQNDTEEHLFVDSYSTFGFKLNNGFRILGPCALFPKTALHWNVTGAEDIHMQSLSLFTTLEPKLDLLIVGVGEQSEIQYVNNELYKDLKSKGIGLELLSTHNACATFNFLNGEKRCVAAALFPPKKMMSRNMDEFMLPDNYSSMGSLTSISDPSIDPVTGEKILVTEEERRFITEPSSPGYWDHGVPEPKRVESEERSDSLLPDSKPDDEPGGKLKS